LSGLFSDAGSTPAASTIFKKITRPNAASGVFGGFVFLHISELRRLFGTMLAARTLPFRETDFFSLRPENSLFSLPALRASSGNRHLPVAIRLAQASLSLHPLYRHLVGKRVDNLHNF